MWLNITNIHQSSTLISNQQTAVSPISSQQTVNSSHPLPVPTGGASHSSNYDLSKHQIEPLNEEVKKDLIGKLQKLVSNKQVDFEKEMDEKFTRHRIMMSLAAVTAVLAFALFAVAMPYVLAVSGSLLLFMMTHAAGCTSLLASFFISCGCLSEEEIDKLHFEEKKLSDYQAKLMNTDFRDWLEKNKDSDSINNITTVEELAKVFNDYNTFKEKQRLGLA